MGTIYVNFGQGVCALNPDGTVRWSAGTNVLGTSFHDVFALPFMNGSAPSVGADGTVYISAGPLYAIGPAGNKLWAAGSNFVGAVVIGPSGALCATSTTGKRLHAFTPAGQETWAALEPLPPPPFSSLYYPAPAVDAGGMIYYCISNRVWALSPDGQVQWNLAASDPMGFMDYEPTAVSPVIGPDGTLYAAFGHRLYAIATGTNGPANSTWPMDRQNARNTGAVNRPVLKAPQKRSDDNVQFQLYGQVGRAFTIEASTNLMDWMSVTSVVAATLPTDVADLTATNAALHFYRASCPP